MHRKISEIVGKTPILKYNDFRNNKKYNIFAKADFLNPSGSVKDVMAYYILKKAEERGELKKGMNILEVTTGNTGISFAMFSKLRGYNFTAVMPEHMSMERVMMMKAYGANVILTPKNEDMKGAIRRYEELRESMDDVWLPKQFENQDNVNAHYEITGKEILRQVKDIDYVVGGIGTGGTLLGISKALKEVYPNVRVVGVEPSESAVLNNGNPGIHNIQGIGEGFIPPLVDRDVLDGVIDIKTKEAEEKAREISNKLGLLVGISSGANILASIRIAEKFKKNKNIVTILPDRGERYLSTGLFMGD